jgi:hypothetical protein
LAKVEARLHGSDRAPFSAIPALRMARGGIEPPIRFLALVNCEYPDKH